MVNSSVNELVRFLCVIVWRLARLPYLPPLRLSFKTNKSTRVASSLSNENVEYPSIGIRSDKEQLSRTHLDIQCWPMSLGQLEEIKKNHSTKFYSTKKYRDNTKVIKSDNCTEGTGGVHCLLFIPYYHQN